MIVLTRITFEECNYSKRKTVNLTELTRQSKLNKLLKTIIKNKLETH